MINFYKIILEALSDNDFPLEVKENGYRGTVSINTRTVREKGKSPKAYKTYRPYVQSGVHGSHVSIIPTGKPVIGHNYRSPEAAIKFLKDLFRSWPTLKDTVYPENLDNVKFPFGIVKDGRLVTTITKHAHPSLRNFSYDVRNFDTAVPGRAKKYVKTYNTLKTALDVAFKLHEPNTIQQDTPIPSMQEVIDKKYVKIILNNRTGSISYKLNNKVNPYFIARVHNSNLSVSERALSTNNYNNALNWLINKLNDPSIFQSLYSTATPDSSKLFLRKIQKEGSYKYEVNKVYIKDSIAEIKLKQPFKDTVHNIELYVSVCANLLLKQTRAMKQVADFLHLMRGKDIPDNNINTTEERNSFYKAAVTNTIETINSIIQKHPDTHVYFADSVTSSFNRDVMKGCKSPKESIKVIPKLTFNDLREQYLANPISFTQQLLRYPKTPRGKYIARAIKILFESDLLEDVLNQKVSTTEIARYVKAVFEISMDDSTPNYFNRKSFTENELHFFQNISWIMNEIKGPTHATRARIGSQKSIPPSFSVFHKLPKVLPQDAPSTVILVDDNLNRFNTYEAINANIKNSLGVNVNIIWVVGAGIKERIDLYFNSTT